MADDNNNGLIDGNETPLTFTISTTNQNLNLDNAYGEHNVSDPSIEFDTYNNQWYYTDTEKRYEPPVLNNPDLETITPDDTNISDDTLPKEQPLTNQSNLLNTMNDNAKHLGSIHSRSNEINKEVANALKYQSELLSASLQLQADNNALLQALVNQLEISNQLRRESNEIQRADSKFNKETSVAKIMQNENLNSILKNKDTVVSNNINVSSTPIQNTVNVDTTEITNATKEIAKANTEIAKASTATIESLEYDKTKITLVTPEGLDNIEMSPREFKALSNAQKMVKDKAENETSFFDYLSTLFGGFSDDDEIENVDLDDDENIMKKMYEFFMDLDTSKIDEIDTKNNGVIAPLKTEENTNGN